MDAESQPGSHSSKRKRKLPAGMSDYQAAWIAEEDLEGLAESASEDEREADAMSHGAKRMQSGDGQSVFMPDLEDDDETDDMQVYSGAIAMQSGTPALCISLRLWPCHLEQELPSSSPSFAVQSTSPCTASRGLQSRVWLHPVHCECCWEVFADCSHQAKPNRSPQNSNCNGVCGAQCLLEPVLSQSLSSCNTGAFLMLPNCCAGF